jgi:hypothetical protein
MLEIIKKNLINGFKTFEFWAKTLSERLKIEINILKLLSEIHKLNEERNKLLIDLGEEIYKSGKTTFNLSEEEKLLRIFRTMRELESEIESKKKKISELGTVE